VFPFLPSFWLCVKRWNFLILLMNNFYRLFWKV
jgi:hypothetical protein